MAIVEKSFNQGDIIFKEGDEGKSFYQLLKGKVAVYADYGKDDPFRIAVLEKGEFFGEMAIIEESPRSATIIAMSPVKVREIPDNELYSFLKEEPEQIINLMKHIAGRITSMTNDYMDSKALLKELKEAEASKKKSLFSKIKKHIDTYQSNKNKIEAPEPEPQYESLEALKSDTSGNTETFTRGKIFFKSGEVGKSLYILKKGTVAFYSDYHKKDEVKKAEINALDVFGEMSLIDEQNRVFDAVAESDETTVEVIYREDIESIMEHYPEKIDLIFRHLSFTLRSITVDFLKICKEITENYGN